MRKRAFALGLVALGGCHTLIGPTPPVEPADASPPEKRPVNDGPSGGLTPTGSTDGSIDDLPADSLTLAARCLDRGDAPAAVAHLRAHVGRHPEQLMIRSYLAELLLRSGQPADAAGEFERFVAAAQDATGPPRAHLVHSHTRLMEIARDTGDEYGEALHRGVGLLRLADQSADDGLRQELLFKAAKDLRRASELRPGDAKANGYLAEVYDRTGTRRAADVARRAARGSLPGSLTAAEHRRIELDAP